MFVYPWTQKHSKQGQSLKPHEIVWPQQPSVERSGLLMKRRYALALGRSLSLNKGSLSQRNVSLNIESIAVERYKKFWRPQRVSTPWYKLRWNIESLSLARKQRRRDTTWHFRCDDIDLMRGRASARMRETFTLAPHILKWINDAICVSE